jgi:hypothetical protein
MLGPALVARSKKKRICHEPDTTLEASALCAPQPSVSRSERFLEEICQVGPAAAFLHRHFGESILERLLRSRDIARHMKSHSLQRRAPPIGPATGARCEHSRIAVSSINEVANPLPGYPVVAGQQSGRAVEHSPEVFTRFLERLDRKALKRDASMSQAEATDQVARSTLIRVNRRQPESPVSFEIPLGVLRPPQHSKRIISGQRLSARRASWENQGQPHGGDSDLSHLSQLP